MSEDQSEVFYLKILLAGDGGVGKSTITQRFVKGRFVKDYKMTVGVDCYAKEVEYEPGKSANISIWDIGGQERFSFLRTNFYYGTDGLLMVFDLTRDQTFRNVRRWLYEIRTLTDEKIPFVLVGNKADLIEEIGMVIDPEEAEAVAEMEDTVYIQTSALTGLNIDVAFSELTKRVISSRTFSVQFYENLWKNIKKEKID